jgi:hypothetical protein
MASIIIIRHHGNFSSKACSPTACFRFSSSCLSSKCISTASRWVAIGGKTSSRQPEHQANLLSVTEKHKSWHIVHPQLAKNSREACHARHPVNACRLLALLNGLPTKCMREGCMMRLVADKPIHLLRIQITAARCLYTIFSGLRNHTFGHTNTKRICFSHMRPRTNMLGAWPL